MERLDICKDMILSIRLLELLMMEVKPPAEMMLETEKTMRMRRGNPADVWQEFSSRIKKIDIIINDMIAWNELQLFGEQVNSYEIKAVVDETVASLVSNFSEANIEINNAVVNVPDLCVRSKVLFKFVLKNLLLSAVENGTADVIMISNGVLQDQIQFTIEGKGSIATKAGISEGFMASKSFKMCFTILSFYGGNLETNRLGNSSFHIRFNLPLC